MSWTFASAGVSSVPAPRPLSARAPDAGLPDELRPWVWRGDALAGTALQGHGAVWPSGHAALDAELPGGGWPATGLTELLQPARVHAEWSLLSWALAQALRQRAGPCVLVRPALPSAGPGHVCLVPFAPGLQALGLPPERLLWVNVRQADACLWACEQALQCAETVVVLAWLDRVRSDDLRRLHRVASIHHTPLFVMRADAQAVQPSPAPLRVQLLQAWPLRVQVLKRRGARSARVLELMHNHARLGLRSPATSAPTGTPGHPLRPASPASAVSMTTGSPAWTPPHSRHTAGVRDALDRPVAA